MRSLTSGARWAHRLGTPRRALYAALSIPLAAAYAALFAGLVAGVVFAVQGVGLLLLLALLATARGLGGLERRLAHALLGLDVAPAVVLRRSSGSRVGRLRALVVSSSTWRTVAWLGVRVLLGAAVLATLVSGLAGVVAVVAELPWSWTTTLPLLTLIAVVLLLVLVALEVQVRIAAAIAPRLLGVAPEERLAALRQASHRLADRNRLARDLHDTIGHALTASLLQATAAGRTLAPASPGSPGQPDVDFARQALQHIETNTRTALAELDRALAVLRDEAAGGTAADPAGAPDLGFLHGLLTGLRDGGLPVTLSVRTDVAELPRPVSELGYRVVQEGTTNVLRHAGGAATTVEVERRSDVLTVRVRNAASPSADSRPGPGGGRGLAGLRDRVAACGGRLTAGPTAEGGFELCAELPIAAPA